MAIIETDVLIVGGGAAGIAAAVSAAQEGVSPTLIERNSHLGGIATAAAVGTICGLYFRSDHSIPKYATSGFAMEFGEKLKIASKTNPKKNKDGLFYLPYIPLQFRLLCENYIAESKVNLMLNTSLVSLEVVENKVAGADVSDGKKSHHIQCKTVIDCTGQAILSTEARLGMLPEGKQQSAAHIFSMEKIDEHDEQRLSLNIIRTIKKGIEEGKISKEAERVTIVPGSLRDGNVFLKLGLLPDTFANRRELLSFSLDLIKEISSFLISNTKAFSNSRVVSIAAEIGFRSGSRPLGKYVLTEEDVLTARKFDDGIANGSWPVEFWNDDKRPKMKYFDMDDYYQIPSGCLISNTATNLYFAGKNISATDLAIASARVMGTCLQTGWAAGKLAAYGALGRADKEAVNIIRHNLTFS